MQRAIIGWEAWRARIHATRVPEWRNNAHTICVRTGYLGITTPVFLQVGEHGVPLMYSVQVGEHGVPLMHSVQVGEHGVPLMYSG